MCRSLQPEKTLQWRRRDHSPTFLRSGEILQRIGPLAVPTEAVEWADTASSSEADNRSLVLFDRGDEVTVQAGGDGIRFLLVSGKPLENRCVVRPS